MKQSGEQIRRKKQIIKQKNRIAEIFILGNKNEKKEKEQK